MTQAQIPDDAGFTLLEIVVTIGIIALLAGGAFVALQQTHAPLATTRAAFATALNETRLLAKANSGTASGAVLVITPQGTGSKFVVLQGRPIQDFAPPIIAPTIPAVTTDAAVHIGSSDLTTVSIAIAPSGHVDILPEVIEAAAQPITIAPGCDPSGAVSVTYVTSSATATQSFDCATAVIGQ